MNSYLHCHYGYPTPIKVAWKKEKSGKRFVGCKNYKIKPCEMIYDFYWKNQQLTHELAKVKVVMKLMEQRNKELHRIKLMVEKNMHYEDTLKMEWNDKYKKKCMENIQGVEGLKSLLELSLCSLL